jgi:DNA-binding XRE family transcriptional regulator
MNTQKLKGLLREKGYTYDTFAIAIGVSRQAVVNCLKKGNTSTDNLLKMAQILEVEPQILLK